MKCRSILRVGLFALAFYTLSHCNKPNNIGSDIAGNTIDSIYTTRDIGFATYVGPADSVRTWEAFVDNTINPSKLERFLCGTVHDPIFGTLQSTIFTQIRTESDPDLDLSPDRGFRVDSAFILLQVDTSVDYGDLKAKMDILLFELAEQLQPARDYFTTDSVPYFPLPVGKATAVRPSPKDTVRIVFKASTTVDTFLYPGAVKIPITDKALLQKLLFDSTVFQNPSSLSQHFNGFRIEVHPENANRLVGFVLSTFQSFLQVHYSNADTVIHRRYFFNDYPIADVVAVKGITVRRNYAGTLVDSLQSTPHADAFGLLQGLGGVRSRIQLEAPPDSLRNRVAIHRATLRLRTVLLPEDDTLLYPPPKIVVTAHRHADGSYTLTEEAALAVNSYLQNDDLHRLRVTYGGILSADPNGTYYEINITSFVQDYFYGQNDGQFYITLIHSQDNPHRLVFCSANTTQCDSYLEILYSKIQP